jgi:predicted lactoylglutathione lyase
MPEPAHRMLFLNLPVADLARSTEFFTRLGFTFNARFTDERATMMEVSDTAFVMLLTRDFFASFTDDGRIAAPGAPPQAAMSFSAASRQEVDRLADLALAGGGSPAGAVQDHGYMYSRDVLDPDGHRWGFVWMAEEAVGP